MTDNGSVYTSRFTHGHNDFELLLTSPRITQKNGHPGHPQTQGKIERFHQTLKRWLHHAPAPHPWPSMQTLLDTFRRIYNTQRPHRAYHPAPHQAGLHRPPKAAPRRITPTVHFRIRHDTVDQFGKLTLRHASRLHHLGTGRTHAGTPVLILVTTTTVTVISKTDHQLIASHTIDPDRNYWRNQEKPRPMAGAICNR